MQPLPCAWSFSKVPNMRKQKGFTLVELLICIAIVFIVASAAFNGFSEYQNAHEGKQTSTPVIEFQQVK